MNSQIIPIAGSTELSAISSTHQQHPNLVFNTPSSDSSVSSISPSLDGKSSMAQYYSDGWVLDGQLETLHESSPRDKSYYVAHSRPASILTADSNSTTLLSACSSSISQQEQDILSTKPGQPIALSSDSLVLSPQGVSSSVVRSISGPHPVIRSRTKSGPHPIIRSYSTVDNYSRPRAAPPPPNPPRFRSYSSAGRSQSRLFEKTRLPQSESSQKRLSILQYPSRSTQQQHQQQKHQLNSRPQIAPYQQVYPRKLQLSRSASSSYPGLPPNQTHPPVPNPDGNSHTHSAFNSHREIHTVNRQTSSPSIQQTTHSRHPHVVTHPCNPLEPAIHGVHTTSPPQSQSQTLMENIQSVFSRSQSSAIKETCPSLQTTSTLSTNPKPYRLTFKSFLESKPSFDSLTQSSHQQQVPLDSVPTTPHRLSMGVIVGQKLKSLLTEAEPQNASTAPILIRNESQDDIIKGLEQLVGQEELRLLVQVEKLLPQSAGSFAEGANTWQPMQDSPPPNRKSTGNGLFGRFGWKQKKSLAPTLSVKHKSRNEGSKDDRRATFGFWGAGSTARVGLFGCPLVDSDPFSCVTVIGGQKHLIPIIMFYLIEEIYVRGMETPGLMRIAGNLEEVDSLAEIFERPPYYGDGTDLTCIDIHVLCSLFKRYLRSLPEPLMSRESFHVLWSHCVRQRKGSREGDVQNRVVTAQCLIRLMPARSFSLLVYVVAFLAQIPLFPQNQFTCMGIAKIFGPALFGTRTQRNAAMDEQPIQALKWLLEHWNMITDGLLNECYVPKIPALSSSVPQSSPAECISTNHPSRLNPPQPPHDSSSSRKDITTSINRPSLMCSTIEPSSSKSAGANFTPFKSLRGYHSQSMRRNSLRSARYIVDCYEAHEKNIVDGQPGNHVVYSAALAKKENAVAIPATTIKAVGLSQKTQQLDGLGSSTNAMTSTQAQGPHPQLRQAPEVNDVNHLKDDDLSCNRLKKSLKAQPLVLNEPLDHPVFTKTVTMEPDLIKTVTNSTTRTNESLHPDSLNADRPISPLRDNSTDQALRLSGILSLEKLDPNFDPERARRIVQKSIEIVDKHQQLLLELKELHSLLTGDLQTTR